MLANTREELNNTILQKLCEKMNPEKLRENDLGMMKGASSYFAIISVKVSEVGPEQNGILGCVQPYLPLLIKHLNISHLHVLVARDSTLIMQCRV